MLAKVAIMSSLGFASAGSHTAECLQQDMDVGGGTNSCGYMGTVAIFAGMGEAKYDWFSGYFKNVPAEDIDSAEKCQAMCEAYPGCTHFAWAAPDPQADCTLKAGYATPDTCTPLYEALAGSVAGPAKCSSCMMEEMDVGGGFNACGYMDNVAIYAKHGVEQQSWYSGYYVVLHDVMTWTVDRCQSLCSANPECAYFHMSEEHCYLKADYSAEKHAEFAGSGGCVPLYSAFDVDRVFKYVSGPARCLEVQQHVSCGHLKEVYKNGMCCGAPSKMVAMP